jgi:cytochrome c oxidase cbb3-type subunit IV
MDIFQTDWAAMTLNDWAGLIITVGIFFLMVWAYVSTFNPKNKEKLESKSTIIFEEDNDMDDLTSTHSTSTHNISTKGDSK